MEAGSERYGSWAALLPLLCSSCLAQPVVMRRDDALLDGIDGAKSERWSSDAQIELSGPIASFSLCSCVQRLLTMAGVDRDR